MRKKNSLYNIIATLGVSLSAIVFNFITQKFIISFLGIEYSGANGLFTNILNMLSIAELGIGSSIVFKLYKPISENDIEKIKSWMKFYKYCYRFIALFVLIAGLLLVPFVPIIVGNTTISENIILLYVISLADVVISYTLTYKRSLLYAYQKNYIVNIVHMICLIISNSFQIIILFVFRNYVYFLILKICFRLLENIFINIYVNKMYPFVKEHSLNLDNTEKKDIFSRIRAIFIQKIAYQINKGIDNIIITAILGIVAAGYYSNYNLIIIAVLRILYWICTSLTASVGNLLTENNLKKNLEIYRKLDLFNTIITCITVVCFTCCVQDFVTLWIGDNYTLPFWYVLCFAFYIYSDSIRNILRLFKEAAGICKEDKVTYIIAVIINLVLSVLLCSVIGIPGVILGTGISFIYLYLYSYPKYVYIPIFKNKVSYFYLDTLKSFTFIIASIILSYFICNIFVLDITLFNIIKNVIICCFTSFLVCFLYFHNTKEYNYYISIIKKIFLKGVNYER